MKIVYVITAAVALLLAAVSPSLGQVPPTTRSTTNSSAVITTGNTFQTVLAAITNSNQRRSLTIQNNNTTDSCWIFIGSGSATKGTSILLLAGGAYTRYYPYVPSDAIQATCASNGDTLYIDRQ